MISHPKVLKKTPKPSVNVLRIADGMVTLAVLLYAAVGDYWDVYFDLQEKLKNGFESNNIAAPVPTRVILNK